MNPIEDIDYLWVPLAVYILLSAVRLRYIVSNMWVSVVWYFVGLVCLVMAVY